MAILTISRECRSGSHEIGGAVARALGYDLISKKRIVDDIKKFGKRWPGVDQTLDENAPSVWERFDWEYQGLVASVESILYEHALADNVVIIGRGGNYLLRDIAHALRIRIVAPLPTRVGRMVEEDGIDEKTARREIARIDKTRAEYVRKNYGRNWEETAHYDMVFNSGTETYEEIAKVIIAALHEKDAHKTAESVDLLTGRADAARIKAVLATESRLNVPTLEVVFDGKSVILKGVIHTIQEHRLVEEIASSVSVSHPVVNTMHYRG
jgi:cytidylate kinase